MSLAIQSTLIQQKSDNTADVTLIISSEPLANLSPHQIDAIAGMGGVGGDYLVIRFSVLSSSLHVGSLHSKAIDQAIDALTTIRRGLTS